MHIKYTVISIEHIKLVAIERDRDTYPEELEDLKMPHTLVS